MVDYFNMCNMYIKDWKISSIYMYPRSEWQIRSHISYVPKQRMVEQFHMQMYPSRWQINSTIYVSKKMVDSLSINDKHEQQVVYWFKTRYLVDQLNTYASQRGMVNQFDKVSQLLDGRLLQNMLYTYIPKCSKQI